jgi:hypothetical protein
MHKLPVQLRNSARIKNILKELDISFTLVCGKKVDTRLIYLPRADGKYEVVKLFEIFKESILADFVFTCTEIEKKLGVKNINAPEKLFQKAVRKLSQKTAQGELGELLLFTLLDVYVGAPKILSKITLKTSRQMPAFGADAVHAQYINDELRLYLGESKLHKSFNGAATKAVTSITNALAKYSDEFDAIDSHIHDTSLTPALAEQLIELLDPFTTSNKSPIEEILHSPCFIGFAEPKLIVEDEDQFCEQYIELAKRHVGSFFDKLKNSNNELDKTILILLPFECTTQLVNDFIKYMDIRE